MLLLVLAGVSASAQAPVIASFGGNGELVCTNLQPGTTASVEWASSVLGPWTNTWAGLDAVTVDSNGGFQVRVPMFYRVRGIPVAVPPAGMVLIPGGPFTMGSDEYPGYGEQPIHTVQVGGFYMDRYEVTKALWDGVYSWAITHGYSFDNAGLGKAATHPAHTVSWFDIVKWCNARSEKEGRVPAYYTSTAQTTVYRSGQVAVQNGWVKWNAGYRLPTEAEWEKASRGGLNGRRFPWGDTISHAQANYYSSASYAYDISPTRNYHPTYATGSAPYTSPVGSFAANGYGLYDMAGNVWEWCWDWYGSYGSASQTDPRGPATGSDRVFRGGSWNYGGGGGALDCRSAGRNRSNPDGGYYGIGFRVVLAPGQ